MALAESDFPGSDSRESQMAFVGVFRAGKDKSNARDGQRCAGDQAEQVRRRTGTGQPGYVAAHPDSEFRKSGLTCEITEPFIPALDRLRFDFNTPPSPAGT